MNSAVSPSPIAPAAGTAPRHAVPLLAFTTPECAVEIFRSWRDIAPEIWTSLFTRWCKDHRYHAITEDTLGDQFAHRYFVFKNTQTGSHAVQPFLIVHQDLAAGLPARFRSLLTALRRRWPGFLKLRMLMVGCAAGDGQLGSEEPWAVRALHAALPIAAKREKASVILLKDFPARYREALRYFTDHGYGRAPSMPGARMEIDFKNFDDFMQNKLGKVFRKNLRRKFRSSADHGTPTMEVVTDVTPIAAEIQSLYAQTHGRSEFKFEELTAAYFSALGQRLPERTRYFLWRVEGRLVAFALCLVAGDTIYDLNVGMDYSVALDLHLYFLTFRDILNWAAENGLKHYVTGPLNYSPKLHLQLDLDPLDLYARHTVAIINPIFKLALKYLQPARHDPHIRQFRNFRELY